METFGTRLAALRKQRGMTQDSIADKLNISAQAMSKWENDLTSPDIDTLLKLSDIFDISLDELMGRVKKDAVMLADAKQLDIDKLTLRVYVDSADNDRVRVNLPVALIRVLVESDGTQNLLAGNKWAKGIDFKEIFKLVEQGLLGELVTVDSAEGDHVRIVVE